MAVALAEESDDENMSEQDSESASPQKPRRGRSRTANQLVTAKAYFPIRDDAECRRFLENTPENLLLDKVIHREIFQIDRAHENPYVRLEDHELDHIMEDDGGRDRLAVGDAKKSA